jgi:hypothetical protein
VNRVLFANRTHVAARASNKALRWRETSRQGGNATVRVAGASRGSNSAQQRAFR